MVSEIAADREIGDPADGQQLENPIAQEERQLRFGGKGTGETQGGFLLAENERPKQILVSAKSLCVITVGPAQLACEDIRGDQGQRRTLPGKERYAGRRIADERHPAAGPQTRMGIHANLTYAIKVEFVTRIEGFENSRALPPAVLESFAQERLLRGDVSTFHDSVIRKCEQDQGTAAAHGEAVHLLAHFRIHHLNQFFSWLVAIDGEGRYSVAQILLELALRAKNELADP